MGSITLAERIKALRKERHMTLEQVGNIVGVGKSTVRKWEVGQIASMREDKLELLAQALGVSPVTLMGWDEEDLNAYPKGVKPMNAMGRHKVPVIGRVAAGEPIYAEEEMGVFVDGPLDCDAALTVQGNSMVPTYLDGDVVYIKCRPEVPDGQIAVVFLDDEATIKHVYKRETGLTLISDNPEFPPILAEFSDYTNVRVFGVPVGFLRMYRRNPMRKVRRGMHT